MDETALAVCPGCSQPIEVLVDPSGGALQEYVEDCPVCCQPNVIRVQFDSHGRVHVLDIESER